MHSHSSGLHHLHHSLWVCQIGTECFLRHKMSAHALRMLHSLSHEWTLAVFMPYVLDWSFHTGQGTFTSWALDLQHLADGIYHPSSDEQW